MRVLLAALSPEVRDVVEKIAVRQQVQQLVAVEVNSNAGFAALIEHRPTHDPFDPGMSADTRLQIPREAQDAILRALGSDAAQLALAA